ncbi:halocarboxylic acid dehydrogenase DehI family protein [Halomarina ordinaria]|uniref:Halocarboxylic acid dehydrogenase DehI family protein n=1 Tax=Halomarina ordinaria TaxID=3033939 RepID=A0ABD5U9J8_9EURY|nr:halocarboxylic acid dehydrogenase DehI family protein [Halomarina sp. PSRA2]
MDTSKQVHDHEATGWQRGFYDDVKHTFRAPVVNWIFRTMTANDPEFARYAWGQVKPLYGTRAFARTSVAYRDAALVDLDDLPSYDPAALSLSPAEFAELRAQLATFDIVAPRLAVLFATVDRALSGESLGTDPADDPATTAPAPGWLDRDRGVPVSMVAASDVPESLSGTVDAVRGFHGLDEGLPSVYRCLAQWPDAFEQVWDDLEPVVESESFERAYGRAGDLVDEYVSGVPYRPRLTPEDLRDVGFEDDRIEAARGLFAEFNGRSVGTVLLALPVFAATVGAGGERALL